MGVIHMHAPGGPNTHAPHRRGGMQITDRSKDVIKSGALPCGRNTHMQAPDTPDTRAPDLRSEWLRSVQGRHQQTVREQWGQAARLLLRASTGTRCCCWTLRVGVWASAMAILGSICRIARHGSRCNASMKGMCTIWQGLPIWPCLPTKPTTPTLSHPGPGLCPAGGEWISSIEIENLAMVSG